MIILFLNNDNIIKNNDNNIKNNDNIIKKITIMFKIMIILLNIMISLLKIMIILLSVISSDNHARIAMPILTKALQQYPAQYYRTVEDSLFSRFISDDSSMFSFSINAHVTFVGNCKIISIDISFTLDQTMLLKIPV